MCKYTLGNITTEVAILLIEERHFRDIFGGRIIVVEFKIVCEY